MRTVSAGSTYSLADSFSIVRRTLALLMVGVVLSGCAGEGDPEAEPAPTSAVTDSPTATTSAGLADPGASSVRTPSPGPTLPVPTVVTSPTPEPCRLFAIEDVRRLMGASVESGRPTGTGRGCSYPGADSGAGPNLLLTIELEDNVTKFAAARDDAAQTAPVRNLPGLGDEAFTYGSGDVGAYSAEARKGARRLRVVVTGEGARPESAEAVLRDGLPRL